MDLSQIVFIAIGGLMLIAFVLTMVLRRPSPVHAETGPSNEAAQEIAALRAENQVLRTEGARLQSIMDNICDMVSEITEDGIFLFASPSHKTTLGYDEKDLIGKSVFDFIHPDDAPHILAHFERGILLRRAGTTEFRCKHAQGHYVWLRAMANVLTDTDGKVTGFVIGNHDINDWKRAEESLRESEERFRVSFEFAPDATTLTTLDGEYVDCNKATEALLGYSREELIGRNIFDFGIFDDDQRPLLREIARQTRQGKEPDSRELRSAGNPELS